MPPGCELQELEECLRSDGWRNYRRWESHDLTSWKERIKNADWGRGPACREVHRGAIRMLSGGADMGWGSHGRYGGRYFYWPDADQHTVIIRRNMTPEDTLALLVHEAAHFLGWGERDSPYSGMSAGNAHMCISVGEA